MPSELRVLGDELRFEGEVVAIRRPGLPLCCWSAFAEHLADLAELDPDDPQCDGGDGQEGDDD